MSKNSKKPIHEKMISQLELPKDLMLGAAIVTITGRKEVLVENYKGIIDEVINDEIIIRTIRAQGDPEEEND